MKTSLRALLTLVLLLGSLRTIAQQKPSPPKTIPDSISYMWKMVESDFLVFRRGKDRANQSLRELTGRLMQLQDEEAGLRSCLTN